MWTSLMRVVTAGAASATLDSVSANESALAASVQQEVRGSQRVEEQSANNFRNTSFSPRPGWIVTVATNDKLESLGWNEDRKTHSTIIGPTEGNASLDVGVERRVFSYGDAAAYAQGLGVDLGVRADAEVGRNTKSFAAGPTATVHFGKILGTPYSVSLGAFGRVEHNTDNWVTLSEGYDSGGKYSAHVQQSQTSSTQVGVGVRLRFIFDKIARVFGTKVGLEMAETFESGADRLGVGLRLE